MARHIKNKEGKIISIGVDIRIANTSSSLLEKSQRVIQSICWKHYPTFERHRDATNRIWTIEITKQRHAEMVLEAMLPHLTVKRAQAEALLGFIRSRKATRRWGAGYTEDEAAIVGVLKLLKKSEMEPCKPIQGGRETKRSTPLAAVAGGMCNSPTSQECET